MSQRTPAWRRKTRHPNDTGNYPDIDLHMRKVDGAHVFTRKDGSPVD